MLLPEQFASVSTSDPFSLPVESLEIHPFSTGKAEIVVSYDQEWRPVFHLDQTISRQDLDKVNLSGKVYIKPNGAKSKVELLISEFRVGSTDNSWVLKARLAREPLVVGSSNKAKGLRALLTSMPDFMKSPIVIFDETQAKYEIERLGVKSSGLYLLRSDLEFFVESMLQRLSDLQLFLTFMKGTHCGIGNIAAVDDAGHVVAQTLGFSRSDRGKRQTNWFDVEIESNLSDIFLDFTAACYDDVTRSALLQTINFYRASNVSREVSVEMAIIASHSGLEAIVNYVLASRAGWSERLVEERSIVFSDKMRAAAAHFGIRGDALVHSPELSALSRARNNMDAYDLISFVRNKLVHQDKKFVPTGIELHEAWLVAQWLLETLVFGVVGYQGKFIDRRVYTGWRGATTFQVPFRR